MGSISESTPSRRPTNNTENYSKMGIKSRLGRRSGEIEKSDSQVGRPITSSASGEKLQRKGTGSKSDPQNASEASHQGNTQLVPYTQPQSPGSFAGWPGGAWENSGEGGGIFSCRKPRDLGAGISSGLKNVVKGVGFGAAALIAAPAVGASEEGLGGFFKGLGAGVIMAVALPVTGVGYGIAQVARGVFHTPEAVREKTAGKKWDKLKREWKENWYSLNEEEEEVSNLAVVFEEQKKELAAAQPGSSHPTRIGTGSVVETEYYDLLGVSTTATPAEIRKAYYKLARECHPDKHPNDPTAHECFQGLGEAYQVLGDEKRRADYDKHGKAAAQEMSLIDSSLFFTMLFGSEALEPFVGKLKMAMFVEIFENADAPGKLTEEVMEFEQRKREVELAVRLRSLIEPYVIGNEQQRRQWREEMSTKARELCKHSFGDAMVEAIGWIYENYSYQFLGKLDTFLGLGGRYAKFKARNRELGNVWKFAGSAIKASVAANKLSRMEEKKEKVAKQRQEREKKEKEDKTKKNEDSKKKTDESIPKSKSDELKNKKSEIHQTASQPSVASTAAFSPSIDFGQSASTSQGNSQAQAENEEEVPHFMQSEEEQKANLEGAKQFAETMPLILETMLSVCLVDVEATVRKVAKKILKDLATPIEVRRQRAEALIELGKIFQQEAEQFKEENKDKPFDVIRQMEEVLIKAAQEADRETYKDEPPKTEQ